jgi:hypothetical protein
MSNDALGNDALGNDAQRCRPHVLQYIGYCYGRVLPDSMRSWVRNDLGGKGAAIRTMIRLSTPAVVVLAMHTSTVHTPNATVPDRNPLADKTLRVAVI